LNGSQRHYAEGKQLILKDSIFYRTDEGLEIRELRGVEGVTVKR
jgi:hypothetical protein